MCLAGRLRVNFLHRAIEVDAGQYARIPRGLFHSTDNLGAGDEHLLEVETPRNKFALVRRNDRYGRQGQISQVREVLARAKGVSEATLKPSVLLGPPHPITGDGRSSWGPRDPLAPTPRG